MSVADDGTQVDGVSFIPNLASGGHLVAFDSAAKTLVADDRKTRGSDIFLHAEDTPTTAAPPSDQRTTPPADEPQAPAESSDPPPENPSPPPDNSSPPAGDGPANGSG